MKEQRRDTNSLLSGREASSFSGSTWLSHVGAGPSCGSRFYSPPGSSLETAARPGKILRTPSSLNSKWSDDPLSSDGYLLDPTSWERL